MVDLLHLFLRLFFFNFLGVDTPARWFPALKLKTGAFEGTNSNMIGCSTADSNEANKEYPNENTTSEVVEDPKVKACVDIALSLQGKMKALMVKILQT